MKKTILILQLLCITTWSYAQLDSNYFQRLRSERVTSENDIVWNQFGPGNAGFSDFLRYHPTRPDEIVLIPDLFVAWMSENNGQNWFNIKDKDGPGNFQRLRELFFSANNEDFGLAIESSHLWRTTDRGRNWSIVLNAPWYEDPQSRGGQDRFSFRSKVSALAIDPTDDNIWYVGEGQHVRGQERFSATDDINNTMPRGSENKIANGSTWQGKIHKTTDGGQTWTTITTGLNPLTQFCRIVVNPTNNQQVFAASLYGLYRSDDGGMTWANIGEGNLPNNTIMDMDYYYNPTTNDFVLYFIDQVRYFPNGNTTRHTGGIYKTEDGGQTFVNINGDITIDVNRLTGGVPQNYDKYIAKWFNMSEQEVRSQYPVRPTDVLQFFNSLNVDPSRPDALYVGFADPQVANSILPGRLWGTSNDGQTWTNLAREFGPAWERDRAYWESRGNPFNDNMNFGHEPFLQQFGQNYPQRALRYCSVNSRGDIMIIAGHNTLLSTDRGATWNQVDEDRTAAGNIMGRGNSNLPGESIYQDKRLGPDRPLMGSGEHRLWLLTDDGTDGRQAARQIEESTETISALTTHPLNKDFIFTTSFRQFRKEKIMRSTDGGETFEVWGDATLAIDQMRTHALGINARNPELMYFGITDKLQRDQTKIGGFYFSDDGGRTFAPRNNGLPDNVRIQDIKVDPRDPSGQSLFAAAQILVFDQGPVTATRSGGLFFTENLGQTWTEIQVDPNVRGINYIQFDNTNRMYVTSGHRNTFNSPVPHVGGIWYSDDFGTTWTRIFDSPRTFYVDVSPFDHNLLVATIGNLERNPGIYLSEDRGLTWSKNNIDGLNTEIRAVEFDLHDPTTLWAVSLGNGFNRGTYANGTNSDVVRVSPFDVNVAPGETETLVATLKGNFTTSNITWVSSNTEVATVDANGEITAVANGQAQIQAQVGDGRYSDYAVVVVNDGSLSTPEVEKEILSTVRLTPNPTTGLLSISNAELVQEVMVYNQNGALMRTLQSPRQIDLSDYSAGLYFVTVVTEKGVATQKVVKN